MTIFSFGGLKSRLLLSILLSTGFFVSFAQQQIFVRSDTLEFVQLKSDSVTFTYHVYTKKQDQNLERIVEADKANYIFTIRKSKAGNLQEISNMRGEKLATVFAGKIKKNNILLANGIELSWKKIDDKTWSYSKEGVEVLRCNFKRFGNVKQFVIQNSSGETIPTAALLSCLEHGIEIGNAPAKPAAMIGAAVLLGIISAIRLLHSSGIGP